MQISWEVLPDDCPLCFSPFRLLYICAVVIHIKSVRTLILHAEA